MSGAGIHFSDSIEENLELIRELLRSVPPGMRNQAKLAAVTIEKAVTGLQRDSQGNQGAALGAAFAIYMIAQRMVEQSQQGERAGDKLIQLLN